MAKHLKTVAVLVAICAAVALLLALTNQITAPIIEENNRQATLKALQEVMPQGESFQELKVKDYDLPETVMELYEESTGLGYAIKLSVTGYGPDMIVLCGVTADGVISGAQCLSSNETLSKEKEYGQHFTHKDAEGVEAVDTIGGATMTTAAYKEAVKDALKAVTILEGGAP